MIDFDALFGDHYGIYFGRSESDFNKIQDVLNAIGYEHWSEERITFDDAADGSWDCISAIGTTFSAMTPGKEGHTFSLGCREVCNRVSIKAFLAIIEYHIYEEEMDINIVLI